MYSLALIAMLACEKDVEEEIVVTAVLATQGDITADQLELAVPGVVGVPNLDDDDQDQVRDWDHGLREGDDDFTTFQMRLAHRTRLTLSGDLEKVRVYHDGQIILSDQLTSVELPRALSMDEFQVEWGDWRATATLSVEDMVEGAAFDVQLTASPLLINHHLQRSVEVGMVTVPLWGGNADMEAGYAESLGDGFRPVPGKDYNYDPWLQDEIEFGTAVGSDGHMKVVMNLIRDRGLDPVAEEMYEGPDMFLGIWGTGRGTSQDYGGNIDVAPPTPEYPLGRIYYGAQGQYKPADEVMELFDAQRAQAPFHLDSSWLCVGHVDEWFTTIPAPGSRLGWKLVYSSDQAAWDALESVDPSTRITRFDQDKHWSTVGELLADSAARSLNDNLTADILEPQLEILKAELNLTDDDIIYIPGLFETVPGCGGGKAALFPGMANLIVADDSSGKTTLYVPDPFMRTDESDQGSDPIIAAFSALMPPELGLVFLDDWDIYHLGLGEVHCGSNVIREPYEGADWWKEGWFLMEGE